MKMADVELYYSGFEEYLIHESTESGFRQYAFRFPNNYGACVTGYMGLWLVEAVKYTIDNMDQEDIEVIKMDGIEGYKRNSEVLEILDRLMCM